MKKVKLKDVVAHLQTLPQDMEVWTFWDEACTYAPAESAKQGHVATIAKQRKYTDGRKFQWREYGPLDDLVPWFGKPKEVVVLDESYLDWSERTAEKMKIGKKRKKS